MADDGDKDLVTLRIGEELLEDLDEYAEEYHDTRTDAIKTALEDIIVTYRLNECREAISNQNPEEYLENSEAVQNFDSELGEYLAQTYVNLEELNYWE